MRSAVLVLAAVLLVVGCVRSPVEHGSVASAARTPSSIPTALAASSSRESVPIPGVVSFSCRLPVRTIDMAGTLTGGFIEFPGGSYTADSAGTFARDKSTGTFRWLSDKQPQLIGSIPLLFYDRAMTRWLPTSREAVYPGGTRYAYVTWDPIQSVHVVDVATGQEGTFPAPHPRGSRVYDYSSSGIYLSAASEGGEAELWLLDPQSGSERLVTSEKIVTAVRDGKAWLGQLTSSQVGSVPDTVIQLDLASRTQTTWFHRQNGQAWLVGFTSVGAPIVTVNTLGGSELWLVPSPGQEKRIYLGPNWFAFGSSDSHGIWLFSADGIYLYSEPGGFQKVSNLIGYPAGSCA